MRQLFLILVCLSATFAINYTPPVGPITQDFQEWLLKSKYAIYDFARLEFGAIGSYGGKNSSAERISKTPVIFIHGNSDGALSNGQKYGTGWSSSIAYFLLNGYKTSELYATTWGDRNAQNSYKRTHNCGYLTYVRKFIEAVLDYTGSPKINIISHSMGVTLVRPVIKGLTVTDEEGQTCSLGDPINHRITTFIGISGGNYGLCICVAENMAPFPTCNEKTGFWPGSASVGADMCSSLEVHNANVSNYSSILKQANDANIKEAQHTYAMWSKKDEILLNNVVYGRHTSEYPMLDDKAIYLTWTHEQTKDISVAQQLEWIQVNSR
uniref:Lipase n=1 Tax=Steinernema glaseri TaxID=37863 RepID=A0A1I8A4L2_9BILA